jgi:CzcA family heavy metal efflux pump
MNSSRVSGFADLMMRHRKAILFLTICLCLGGIYAATRMPSAVFPQTDFPRVVVLVDNGVMPSDEMMATVTRPIEEAVKGIPGVVNIRSATGRGSAEVNVFFDWRTDMVRAELYVLGRIAQVKSSLPATATTDVHRMTFSEFPIIGISLTSPTRNISDLWETARYNIKPRFLRIAGVARVNIVGGREPEYHVLVDPLKLEGYRLTLDQLTEALAATNLFVPVGMHEEDYQLYLGLVDGRTGTPQQIKDIVIRWSGKSPVRIGDVAEVMPGRAPQFNVVTADGTDAVLLNVYSQPDGSTLRIANALQAELKQLRQELPPDIHLAFFYDQSTFVREAVGSVWESILFGLVLSIAVLYLFLRTASTTAIAALVIPVTVLITVAAMQLMHMTFNLMTLGGIAAAIGLVIDDAIVVVEDIYSKVSAGLAPAEAVRAAAAEVSLPLVGSTLTPIVVFIPLAFLDGVAGVFFRALAVTMVVSLLTSLFLAVTVTPTLGALFIRKRRGESRDEQHQGGPILRRLVAAYEWAVRRALTHAWVLPIGLPTIILGGLAIYSRLETDFLPPQDEGGFVLDYFSAPGTSLAETDRMLRHVEQILRKTPEVASYSRRTGARLALAIAEPNTGDFLVKLRGDRRRSTQQIIDELRDEIHAAEPALQTEFPGILSDLIGDLTWSPEPVEIKIFSNDAALLRDKAAQIARTIESIPGVVDVNDGLVVAGPTLRFRVRNEDAARVGLTVSDIGSAIETAILGKTSSYVLEGDRIKNIRVKLGGDDTRREQTIRQLPVRSKDGMVLTLEEVADVQREAGQLEMHREDLRELAAVTARFTGVDLGTGMRTIQKTLADRVDLPPGTSLEYGGLYQQQQESFRNLTLVLILAIVLVYTVLLVEFRSLLKPLAIMIGSVLALAGVVAALWITGVSLNIVSFLGAIMGVGIVAKNGILMFDFVDHLEARGLSIVDALVQSGRRRLRPVLMTSLTAAFGMLPLSLGIGTGAQMLRPLAIAVMGALAISVLLSLIATPSVYYFLLRIFRVELKREEKLAETVA